MISGLSRALIVVEAALRSGSLISAKLALEQNREVMAVPGPITVPMSRGTNWLIQSGAKLIANKQDVLEELPQAIRDSLPAFPEEPAPAIKLSSDERSILALIPTDGTLHIDELVSDSSRSVSEVLTILLGLELKDAILQHPGKHFQRKL